MTQCPYRGWCRNFHRQAQPRVPPLTCRLAQRHVNIAVHPRRCSRAVAGTQFNTVARLCCRAFGGICTQRVACRVGQRTCARTIYSMVESKCQKMAFGVIDIYYTIVHDIYELCAAPALAGGWFFKKKSHFGAILNIWEVV